MFVSSMFFLVFVRRGNNKRLYSPLALQCNNRHTDDTEAAGADLGGVQGVATPPNGQSHSIKYSTANVLRYAQALVCIAKSLVVVVVSSKRVVKPLSRQAVVQPEVLHLLECLLWHSTARGN